MEVKKTIITSSKTASIIDFSDELESVPENLRDDLLQELGELLKEEVLSYVADSTSPITNNKFAALKNGPYKKMKIKETGSDKANLDLSGEMMNSLDYSTGDTSIELGVYGEAAPRADGHNNLSGESDLTPRQFLPDIGDGFAPKIKSLIDEKIEAFVADNIELDNSKLKEIATKKELYDYLRNELGEDLSKTRIKELILQSELATSLDEFDLLDLL